MRKVLFILGQLSDQDVEWLTANGHRETFAPDAVLIREGQPIDSLFIVLEGLLSVTDRDLGNAETARLGSGEIVGEISFVDGRPPSATVRAVQRTIALKVGKPLLQRKIDVDQGFAARFYRALAMFLSDRLRTATHDSPDADELDPNVLDAVHLAGSRFDRMMKQLMLSA
jgi:CRP/FNR family cyclic AMP-dependent transcriptional regulator